MSNGQMRANGASGPFLQSTMAWSGEFVTRKELGFGHSVLPLLKDVKGKLKQRNDQQWFRDV